MKQCPFYLIFIAVCSLIICIIILTSTILHFNLQLQFLARNFSQNNVLLRQDVQNFRHFQTRSKEDILELSRDNLIKQQLDGLHMTNVTITSDNDVRNVQSQLLYQTPWFQSTEICIPNQCCARSFVIPKSQEEFTPITVFTPRELAEIVVRGIHRPPYVYFKHDELYDNMIPCLQPGVIIQVDGNIVTQYFQKVHHQIPVEYILVSGDTFYSPNITQEIIDILDDPKLLHWFAHHLPGDNFPNLHPKITPMPIGTSQWRPHRPILQKILAKTQFRNPFSSRKYRESLHGGKLYINFHARVPKDKYVPYLTERGQLYDTFCGENQPEWAVCDSTMNASVYQHYVREIESNVSFVLSPRGMGFDTYRVWENLALGIINIVDESVYKSIYDGLPIIVLPSLLLSQDELREIMDAYTLSDQFLNSDFDDWNRVFVSYWRKEVFQKAGRENNVYVDPQSQSEYYMMWKYGNYTFYDQRV